MKKFKPTKNKYVFAWVKTQLKCLHFHFPDKWGGVEFGKFFFSLKNSKPTLLFAVSGSLAKQFTCVSSK